ncbi:MAG: hypothetical protein LAP39_13900 [Acidobacteriia bacterium]|nr:hypothetical protein [Terriglobia bacterium]
MSIAALAGLDKAAPPDKDQSKFELGPAASYPSHQTSEKVTIGASVYDSAEKAHAAFGKVNPYQYGILPVLVVIQNDSGQTMRVDRMRVDYVSPGGGHVDATPAADVRFLNPARQPNVVTGPLPTKGPHISRKKNPLDAWEIDGRAFAAKMIPPGQSAGGFFYFQTGNRPGARLYVTGLEEASSGRELLYFEFPLKDEPR